MGELGKLSELGEASPPPETVRHARFPLPSSKAPRTSPPRQARQAVAQGSRDQRPWSPAFAARRGDRLLPSGGDSGGPSGLVSRDGLEDAWLRCILPPGRFRSRLGGVLVGSSDLPRYRLPRGMVVLGTEGAAAHSNQGRGRRRRARTGNVGGGGIMRSAATPSCSGAALCLRPCRVRLSLTPLRPSFACACRCMARKPNGCSTAP